MSTGSYQLNGYTNEVMGEEAGNTRNSRRTHCRRGSVEQEDQVLGVMNANLDQLSENARKAMERVIRIGAVCIAEIEGRFFLLVEVEVEVPGEDLEQVVIFEITEAQAAFLFRSGVRHCIIRDTIPTSRPGVDVDLICAFVVGNFVFLVFDVENNFDKLVLVRVPLCTIV